MLTMLLLMGCPLISDADIDAKLTTPGDSALVDSGAPDTADTGGNDTTDTADSGGGDTSAVDDDSDGYAADVDCNDDDAAIHPDADETWYDGVDQDCAGDDDYDQDEDGYRSSAHGGDDCADDPFTPTDVLSGFPMLIASDVHPDATDTWYDNVDQDCAGDDDFDQDADGVRAEGHPDADDVDGTDCDDLDADVSPDLAEVWYDGVDRNCDGANDYDQDGDTYCPPVYAALSGCSVYGSDCNDDSSVVVEALPGFPDLAARDVHPGAIDAWYDGIDANCDLLDDFDADGDSSRAASVVDELGARGDDCDDTDRYVSPTASEVWYDGVDDDCDGNDGDRDGDGYCRVGYGAGLGCDLGADDCQDNPTTPLRGLNGFSDLDADHVYPSAVEFWYDGIDQDCAGDDDFDADDDGVATDEYASASGAIGNDCDDADASRSPLLPEVWYDGVDQRCDGGDDFDRDGDGWGAVVGGGTDCDDTVASVYPGATETCATTADDDCDGSSNDVGATACSPFFVDLDADGYGTTVGRCTCRAEGSYTASVNTDCADASAATNPGATEVCNDRIDNNCDGIGCRLGDHLGDFSSTSTTTPHYYGASTGAQAGAAVAGVRDWTGDGLNDYVVGAPGVGNGTVYLVEGSTSPASASLPSVRAFTGEAPSEGVGSSLSGAWDVNADGYADFLVGARGQGGAGVGAGAAYLVLGNRVASGSLAGATKFTGVASGDHAGDSVAGLGSFDGDAYGDFVVAAPDAALGAGVAYLQRGSAGISGGSLAGAVAYTGTLNYRVSKVAAAGDTNGDGMADLLVGDGVNGRLMVVFGTASPVGVTLNNSLFTGFPAVSGVAFTATTVGGGIGTVVSGAGDVNGDGYADLLAGVPRYNTDQGAIVVVLGEASPLSEPLDSTFLFGTGATGEYVGTAVSPAGDMDDDGFMDVLVGAPSVAPGANLATASSGSGVSRGKVRLYYGSSRGLTASGALTWNGLANGNFLGYSLASVGDVNGDRYRDLLFGEPGNDEGSPLAGAAYLVRGYGM